MKRWGLSFVVGLALVASACGDVGLVSATTAEGETGSATTHDPGLGPVHPTRPPPGSPSGSVRIKNPCDTAIEVRWRLTPRGKGGVPPNVIVTVQPGRAENPSGYQYAAGTGSRDVMVFAPKLGWRARKRARQDGGVVRFTIDPDVCPPTG